MIRKCSLKILLTCLLLLGSVVCAQDTNPAPGNVGGDPVYQGLSVGNVYVDPRVQGIDTQKLMQATMQGQDNPHTRVKIAILADLPASVGSRSHYGSGLYRNLGLDKDALILVVLGGQKPGVEVLSQAMSQAEETRLAQHYGSAVNTNPTDGTAALAQAVASDINGREYQSSAGLWVVFLVVVVVIGGLLLSASRRKRQALTVAREPIQALRDHVLSGIEYLDGYTDVLPKNNPDSDQVRLFRQSASAKYEQAVKIMDRATEMTDLNRAQALFTQAQADVDHARRYQDRATGGTGNIPGDDAVRPQALPDSQPAVEAIPTNQRGVSFFSGRPAPLGSLVPVTLTIGGQSRQVLVTPDEADELRRGRMPQVLAFQQPGGQSLPWYEYNNYDPYRDYWRYENSGWNGFGTGLAAGFIGAELLDSLTPAYGMSGALPYAYATDTSMYQGYADPGYAAPGFDSAPDFSNNGSDGDFMTSDGGNYDTSGFDPSSQDSGDFFTDSGGGFDSGGFDGGGGDSGGGGD